MLCFYISRISNLITLAYADPEISTFKQTNIIFS